MHRFLMITAFVLVIFGVLRGPLTNEAVAQPSPPDDLTGLTARLLVSRDAIDSFSGRDRGGAVDELVRIAKMRMPLLRAAALDHSEEVTALLIRDQSGFPDEVLPYLEKATTRAGYLQAIHSDAFEGGSASDNRLDLYESADSDNFTPLVSPQAEIIWEQINRDVVVDAFAIADLLWIDSAAANIRVANAGDPSDARHGQASGHFNTTPVAGTSSFKPPTGHHSIAIHYITTANNRNRRYNQTELNNFVQQFKDFVLTSSSGTLVLDWTSTWFDADFNTICEIDDLKGPFKTAAREHGIEPDNYEHNIVVYDYDNRCPDKGGQADWNGWAFSTGFFNVAHEFGHNIGLAHAWSWDCADTVIHDSCNQDGHAGDQYGNPFDVMAGANTETSPLRADYGSYAKHRLGWFAPEEVTNFGSSGSYTIRRIDAPRSGPGPYQPRALRIPTFNDGPAYYVEYQAKTQTAGPLITLASGALVDARITYLLDTTPDSATTNRAPDNRADFEDGVLHLDDSFDDPFNGIRITLTSRAGDNSTVTLYVERYTPTGGAGTLDVSWSQPYGYLGTVAQKKDMDWEPIHYIFDFKCTQGFGCTNQWNQWTSCGSWPRGYCPSYDVTDPSVQVLVGDSDLGYRYKYRVWMLTKNIGNPNLIGTYIWIGETDFSANCSGSSCTTTISWPRVTYRASLERLSDGLPACTGVTTGCQSLLTSNNGNTFESFRGIPTGVTFKGRVTVRDFGGTEYLLVEFPNMGTSDNRFNFCSSNTTRACSIPFPAFIGNELLLYSVKLNGPNGMIIKGPGGATASGGGSYANSWTWDSYPVEVFPVGYTSCAVAGRECQKINVDADLGTSFVRRFVGLRPGTTYNINVCANTCVWTTGNPYIYNYQKRTTDSGPSFFDDDPFDGPPAPPTPGLNFDFKSSASAGSVSSLSWQHTVGTGVDRALLVGVSVRGLPPSVTSATYAGQTMTFVGARANGGLRTELWRLANPPSGTSSITVQLSGAGSIVAGGTSWTGVDQTAPTGAYASNVGFSTSPSVSLQSLPGEVVVDVLSMPNLSSDTAAAGSGQTERWNIWASGDLRGTSSSTSGATNVTMSWTTKNEAWSISAVALKPVVNLFRDDFNSSALDSGVWGTSTAGGATVSQSGGVATITIPAVANAYADLYSLNTFDVGSTFEARLFVSAGQFFDHKGVGYANARVSSDCGVGETEAAIWRGQDGTKVTETKTGGSPSCVGVQSNYPGGWRTIKIVRVSETRADFYEDGVLLRSQTSLVPTGTLSVRFSGWTYTWAPASPITIQVDWVKVSSSALLYDDFNSGGLSGERWNTAVSAGSSVSQSGGVVTITLPATANAWADLYSLASFPVGTTFEARVYVSAGQWFDHKGIGYANAGVGSDCGSGETEAAMWRGQDGTRVVETKAGGVSNCAIPLANYPGGWRTIKIVRVSTTKADFYEDGVLLGSLTSMVPTGALPIRFSGWTYTYTPGSPLTIQVDWIKVSAN